MIFYTSLNGAVSEKKGVIMQLPWKKQEKVNLLDIAEQDLVEAYLAADTEEKKTAILADFMELDARRLEYEKIYAEHRIDPKSLLTNGVTILLAAGTLIFEREDVLRSKVTQLWLRRRQ